MKAGIWNLDFLRGTQNLFSKILTFFLVVFFLGCNAESVPDCFQAAGEITVTEVTLPEFSKITVFENVNLVLRQGTAQRVQIQTGDNLREEVSAIVENDRLILRNTNDCNYVRDYGLTKIVVTAPNITEIRSSTGLAVESDGVLAYPNLTLLSESFLNTESETTDGEFDLDLDTQNLTVTVNGITYFKLRGTTTNLSLNIAAGDSRVEAGTLIAETVDLNHRGTNDMFVNPQNAIRGLIRGTGDVIGTTRPAIIEVEELYKGTLIFKD